MPHPSSEPANDVVELSSFVSTINLVSTYGASARAFKVVSAGSGVLIIRTARGDRTLTVAAGDSLDVGFSHVLVGTNVAVLQVAF